ncbi:glycosyltransferase family 2 protein [Nesterenkonia alkaliphila]|uniref:Glycosyltransferase n=1 Tax=Nesterenkonia alkaliphila TaxID=1463631 RepID=A0A7K1UKH1_9MICC|nr:glycosyltransferase family 2 protein [Nesterenkonia alkaliphila]MVT26997.1 glycosyltransferase [Nesterenkonia alkaliphila]GGA00091.1 hypothetical protein GCM10011359_31000 [Nesterenkonia alkaliphila]
MITVIIPAHNEADALPTTIASLRAQTVSPDRVLVVSDNSTDQTVEVARSLGVDVMETIGNTARKAGALNQALATLDRTGLVLVMDADTELVPTWIETALSELDDPTVGGVGAVFHGGEPDGYLQLCQKLEWERYAEQIDRTGKVFVLSGTAALIRWEALEDVRHRFGHWYDTATITEDMKITLALKECGWTLRSPVACKTITEMMPTPRMLFLQRRRWYLGALQNVMDMGFTRVTAPYWGQQVMLAVSVLLLWTLIVATAVSVAINGWQAPQLFWLAVGGVFVIERVLTIWDQPVRYRVFAALIIPELVYSLLLQASYVAAVWQKLTGSAGSWHHVETPQKEAPDVRI